MRIAGGCHCGNLRLTLDWPDAAPRMPARACDCGFCTRHGGVWTSHPAASVTLDVGEPALVSRYAFATRTATFHICARCGVVPLVTCALEGRTRAVVNVNVLEDVPVLLDRAPASFAAEDVGVRLARRARNWIATVRIRPPPPRD
jgi:hypothetical protein